MTDRWIISELCSALSTFQMCVLIISMFLRFMPATCCMSRCYLCKVGAVTALEVGEVLVTSWSLIYCFVVCHLHANPALRTVA
jgi:hypothetical protein